MGIIKMKERFDNGEGTRKSVWRITSKTYVTDKEGMEKMIREGCQSFRIIFRCQKVVRVSNLAPQL